MGVAKEMSKSSLKVSVSDSSSQSSFESENEDVDMDAEKSDESDDLESISSNKSNEGRETLLANEGWADSIAKILGSKKPKNKKSLVLSRAKKYVETIKTVKDEKPVFEIIGEEIKKEKFEIKDESVNEQPVKIKKHDKPRIRVKPNILEKDRERLLTKIATKGVVQLFNAVRNQQKSLEKDMDRSDLSEGKKEKIMKKFDKRAFLDTLMGQTKSINVDAATHSVQKEEVKDEDSNPKWNALRDDFMMGAKMKDWDKESIDE